MLFTVTSFNMKAIKWLAAMCACCWKKKRGKNQDARREACVNLGQNNGAVKIHQDTGRSKAQNQDCPSSSWVNRGVWSPEDSDTHFKWNLPSQNFFANYCRWNWFVLQLFTFVFNLCFQKSVFCATVKQESTPEYLTITFNKYLEKKKKKHLSMFC